MYTVTIVIFFPLYAQILEYSNSIGISRCRSLNPRVQSTINYTLAFIFKRYLFLFFQHFSFYLSFHFLNLNTHLFRLRRPSLYINRLPRAPAPSHSIQIPSFYFYRMHIYILSSFKVSNSYEKLRGNKYIIYSLYNIVFITSYELSSFFVFNFQTPLCTAHLSHPHDFVK